MMPTQWWRTGDARTSGRPDPPPASGAPSSTPVPRTHDFAYCRRPVAPLVPDRAAEGRSQPEIILRSVGVRC